ncbi:hypothetical protein PMAYCL1PPCAC_28612, partial [Pristionchus mayeri]
AGPTGSDHRPKLHMKSLFIMLSLCVGSVSAISCLVSKKDGSVAASHKQYQFCVIVHSEEPGETRFFGVRTDEDDVQKYSYFFSSDSDIYAINRVCFSEGYQFNRLSNSFSNEKVVRCICQKSMCNNVSGISEFLHE